MKKRMIWNNDVCSEMDALEKDGFFAESEITSEEEKKWMQLMSTSIQL